LGLKTITLKYAVIEPTDLGCRVYFQDGKFCDAHAHATDHYKLITARLGYGHDTLAYCREHEFAHCFLEEKFFDRPSKALWAVAHGPMLSGPHSAYEEIAAQTFQRFLRANERPIVGGVRWDDLKAEALEKLGDGGSTSAADSG
jgi:hypothetical protein